MSLENLCEAGCLCRMAEGNVTYQPRYILPDYVKIEMREGCKFLRLDPPAKFIRSDSDIGNRFIVMSHQLHIIRFTWDL